jgi:hypothetical protein
LVRSKIGAGKEVLMKARYYSPRLERDLIAVLFRERCKRKVPMTTLASSLIRAALRYEGIVEPTARVAESAVAPRRIR